MWTSQGLLEKKENSLFDLWFYHVFLITLDYGGCLSPRPIYSNVHFYFIVSRNIKRGKLRHHLTGWLTSEQVEN